MAKFARLFELENDEQLLVTVEYNQEEDHYNMNLKTDFKGMSAEIGLGFKKKAKALKAMNDYTQADAVKCRASIQQMLE